MSQSHNPTDPQALVQSMLQRLKIQPGREGQAYLNSPLPTKPNSTWVQNESIRASNHQGINSPVNGFQFGNNGIRSKDFGISALHGNFGFKVGEIQQPAFGSQAVEDAFSSSIQTIKINGDRGEERVFGQATQPWIPSAGERTLFPAKSLGDTDSSSSGRTDGQRVSFYSTAMTSQSPSDKNAVSSIGRSQDRGFTSRPYAWSFKPTIADVNTGGQVVKVFHEGNGALAEGKDMQIVLRDSSSIGRPRSLGNKTRRWTQKIKQRWRDRPGSFGKKGNGDDRREEQKSKQGTDNQPQTTDSFINTLNEEEEEKRIFPSLDSTDSSSRSNIDFDFGLGSFSLLEEIATGQEWAKFLNLDPSATSAPRRPSEEKAVNPQESSQSSPISNQRGDVINTLSFRGMEDSPVSGLSGAKLLPDELLPVIMDMSEGKQQKEADREADQSEPMEDGPTPSDSHSGDSELEQKLRPPSSAQSGDTVRSSELRTRSSLGRKRQHRLTGMRYEKILIDTINDDEEADQETHLAGPPTEGSISPLCPMSSDDMEGIEDSKRGSATALKSPPPPLSPNSFAPFAKATRGVLKHSISHDSQLSTEIDTKRRKVEENRRVQFSEEVVTIMPPEIYLNATDSEEEEDSVTEEDSLIEEECEVEEALKEEVAPMRRSAVPAWILALKRKNLGRK